MLVLVRKAQQGIWIEGGIWVKVLSIERDRVKLGIDAPRELKVMRQELLVDGEERQEEKNSSPSSEPQSTAS